MTVLQEPEEIYPAALRKLFFGNESGPMELSAEEVKEAREWKRQLDLDILEIDLQLDKDL